MVRMKALSMVAVGGLLCMSACSLSPRVDTVAPLVIDLTGQWSLDRHASDDVRARLAPLIEKKERRWRSLEKRMTEEAFVAAPGAEATPQDGATDQSTMQWLRRERQQEAEALIAFIAPPTQLDIRQAIREGRQEISVKTDKGEGTRVLVPGQTSSLFVGVGGFKLNSGWQGEKFIVDLSGSGENSMHVVQYYTVFDAGKQMEMRMETRLPEFGKQAFRFIYKRNSEP
jgi:hypothetical protein